MWLPQQRKKFVNWRHQLALPRPALAKLASSLDGPGSDAGKTQTAVRAGNTQTATRPFSWHVSTARGLACGHSPRPGCGRSLSQARHRLALQRSARNTNRLSPRSAGGSEIIRCWCVFFGACRACRAEAQWNLHGCNIGDMRGAVRLAEDQALIISHEGSSTTEDPTYA